MRTIDRRGPGEIAPGVREMKSQMRPDGHARLPQVRREDFTDEVRAFFAQWVGEPFRDVDENPVLRTYAHHPALADAASPLNIHLLSTNTLPVGHRQIAIMRTAWITNAVYMWSSHLQTSLNCGLSPDMFGPVQRGAEDPWFTDFERLVMQATDELVNDRKVSDSVWTALAKEWSKQQLLDFLFTVGAYVMLAGVMRSTGVERRHDLLELAEKYGAPEEN